MYKRQAQTTPCDRLVSHPSDPLRIAEGIVFGEISSEHANQAVKECQKAIEQNGNQPRYRYLLARAHGKVAQIAQEAGNQDRAKQNLALGIENLQDAKKADYPMAFNNLALAFAKGEGVGPNTEEAKALYLERLNRFIHCCWAPIAEELLKSNAQLNRDDLHLVIRELTKWAAALGDSRAVALLKRLAQDDIVDDATPSKSANFQTRPPWLRW